MVGAVGTNQDRAALEVVVHDAVHFLTMPESPLSMAIGSAIKASGIAPPRMDLVHAMHFFVTGEAVRCAFARVGGPPYTMYLSVQKLFPDRFRESVAPIWTAYIDGGRTLTEAVAEKVRALAP